MGPWAQSSEGRFAEYVDALTTVMGRGDRARPLKDYCIGFLMPGERKSVEQSLRRLGFRPSISRFCIWSARRLGQTRRFWPGCVNSSCRRSKAQGKIEAWIVDDTGFAKKGVHSVGVGRQYCGRLGKTDNCQIAVTLSIANHAASLPIAYRLYLPEDWAADEARRKKARVPDEVKFQTKPEIALDQIGAALAAGVAPGVLLADAGYAADGAFRSGVTASGLRSNGSSSNGPRAKKSQRNTGSRPCPQTRPSPFSSTRPNCAGASNATTMNSKANSASPISKGEAGAASIITQRCTSHLPPVPDPEAPPIRPERHIENSIATIRRQLTVALARILTRCPCCQAMPPRPPYRGSS